jgi:hypothetical protein
MVRCNFKADNDLHILIKINYKRVVEGQTASIYNVNLKHRKTKWCTVVDSKGRLYVNQSITEDSKNHLLEMNS